MMRLGARPDEVDFFQGILFCSKIDLTTEQSLIVHLPPCDGCLQSLLLILALAFKHTHLKITFVASVPSGSLIQTHETLLNI